MNNFDNHSPSRCRAIMGIARIDAFLDGVQTPPGSAAPVTLFPLSAILGHQRQSLMQTLCRMSPRPNLASAHDLVSNQRLCRPSSVELVLLLEQFHRFAPSIPGDLRPYQHRSFPILIHFRASKSNLQHADSRASSSLYMSLAHKNEIPPPLRQYTA